MQAWICIDRSSRPPNAPPTPPRLIRTFSGGRSRAAAVWSRSTCSHWVATKRSTPPSSAGTARPDSGPRKAWSCMPTSYSPVTTTSAVAPGSPCSIRTWRRRLPDGCSGSASIAFSGSVTGVEHLVVDLDLRRGVARRLRVVGGDDRHRLALVAHLVEGQHRLVGDLEPVDLAARHVLVGEDGVHAADGERGGEVDLADAGARVRAAQGRAPQHSVGPQVRRVGEVALDLGDAVRAAQALADPAADRRSPTLIRAPPASGGSPRRCSRAISSSSAVVQAAALDHDAAADEQRVDDRAGAEHERGDGVGDPRVVEVVEPPQRDVGQLAGLERADLLFAAEAARRRGWCRARAPRARSAPAARP